MYDIREQLQVCPDCRGVGWIDNSDPNDPRKNGEYTTCPVRVYCKICEGTGIVWKKELAKDKEKAKIQAEEDDLQF